MIVIVDYGMGNLSSVQNMLKKVGAEATISADPKVVAQAGKLILPGVGAFDSGMQNLERLGLRELLHRKVIEQGTLVLGICLGLQLMTRKSEEGQIPGLGWLGADTVRFNFTQQESRGSAQLPNAPGWRVPHMGWNDVKPQRPSTLFSAGEDRMRFYFVHSYHLVCDDPADVLATTEYGYEFVSAVQRENLLGTQFHPEKSHRFGYRLFEHFLKLSC